MKRKISEKILNKEFFYILISIWGLESNGFFFLIVKSISIFLDRFLKPLFFFSHLYYSISVKIMAYKAKMLFYWGKLIMIQTLYIHGMKIIC